MPTEAHKERNRRHRQTLDQLVCTVPKGAREKIREHAISKTGSINSYIIDLIEKDMGCSVKDLAERAKKEISQE